MYKILICKPEYFNQELASWLKEQDEKHKDHITDFKIEFALSRNDDKVIHYIRYELIDY